MRDSTMAQVTSRLWRGWGELGYWVREYFGENAYPRYIAAWHTQHTHGNAPDAGAESRLLSAREFFDQRLERTFGADSQRCC